MARALMFTDDPAYLTDLAGFAKEFNLEAIAITAGKRDDVSSRAYTVFTKIYHVGERVFTDQLVSVLSRLFDEVKPDLVVGPATKNGNEVAARLAARKSLAMLTEVVEVSLKQSEAKLVRQVLGGRSLAVVYSKIPVALTIPPRKWSYEGKVGAPLESIEPPPTSYKLIEMKEKVREAINIEEAEVVVGVGRGFRRKEDLRLAEELAELLGGVVGCTRPIAADYGWLSEDRWIGISGKKIRPKLYIAIGISGAPQHMAATMDSRIIVAINKDRNAPIFQYADYGVVADLYQFVPVLIKKLKERMK
jgi:electron transfer flavoprotein alpha subunit